MPGVVYKNEIEQICDVKWGKNFCDFCCNYITVNEENKYEDTNMYFQREITELLSEYLVKKLTLVAQKSFTFSSWFIINLTTYDSKYIIKIENEEPFDFDFILDIFDTDSLIYILSIAVLVLTAKSCV